ncbi:retrovirus-related pol polyprotein from transposon TNT 1-94 [Tanacetum coccineum]
MLEKNVNTTLVDYARLNQLSQDFVKRFVPQTELSAEQDFWSQNSMISTEPTLSRRPTIVEVPKELPKVSMVNTSLKKLKHHLAGFDVVVKERTTPTAITEGSWGFEHTKACFRDEIIPFVKALKDLFNTFNQYLVDELSEVQNVFHQMEQAVEQHRLESKTFEVKMNQVLNENERLLEQVLSKDIVNIIVNSSMINASVNVHECEKCLHLETELQTDFIEKEIYDKLFKSFTTLEKHCISLDVNSQLNQISTTTKVPLRTPTALENETPKPVVTLVYSRKPRKSKTNVLVSKYKVLKSVSANKKEHSKSWGSIVSDVPSSSLDECRSSKLFYVKFGNDHMVKILGYGDYQIGNVTSKGLLRGRTWTQLILRWAILYNGVLSHMSLVKGLKDKVLAMAPTSVSSELCKKKPYKPKFEDTNQEKLYLLHMDLCGPMRIASINGKKYILVIVYDYSRFTWVKFLRSKDEAPDFIIKFLKMIQKVGISYEISVARSPRQNGVVERRNRTLIEAARTMLIYAKAPLFLWAKAVATACYTQNRSIIRLHHGKTPYELLHDKLPDLSFFHVFGALCYPTNDSENLGNLQPKADIDFDELTAMASKHSSLGPVLHEMTPVIISLGLVPNPPPSTPFVPPSRTDWDILFQPLFDELLTPPPSVDLQAPEVIAPIDEVVTPVLVVLTGSPSSTTVDQDAPSPSNSQTTPETQPPVIPNDVE